MKINMYGQPILSSSDVRDLILQGKHIDRVTIVEDKEFELFNKYQDILLNNKVKFITDTEEVLSFDDFHLKSAEEWTFPDEYQKMDVYAWLINKCNTQAEIDRVNEEYELYKERDLIMLLRLFIFLVDYMRKNKFIWGVGRGSSVSSYILYKIGIHRVDSLKFGFSIKDYLK